MSEAAVDVDSLLGDINSAAPERPMTGGAAADIPKEFAEAEAAPPLDAVPPPDIIDAKLAPIAQEFEFDWSGKKIKAPIDMILSKYAPMGYDYAQRMQAFKAEQAQKVKDLDQKYAGFDKYSEIDEYAKKDPEWWDHVNQQWQERLSSQDPTIVRVKSVLDQELKPFKELVEQQAREKQEQEITKQDQALFEDMKSIRDQFKDLDFDSPDAEGKSLELRVLEHGVNNDIKSFKTAFRDFYHDQLMQQAESRGREAITKDTQQRVKLGLSGPTPTPKKSLDDSFDVRGKSYNDLLDEATSRFL